MSQVQNNHISSCKTHHIDSNSRPLYKKKFDSVLAFHEVDGLLVAPVTSNGKGWHIDIEGKAIYSSQYQRTFGFYCGYAAVILDGKWAHIDINGKPIYKERYVFAGNYQENICVVCDENGLYFHINTDGVPIYQGGWQYCGDFHEDCAVVQDGCGLSTHINKSGQFIHNTWFADLDVFHKGYARAKDAKGWCHIDQAGLSIYSQRYCSVEPFYNGFARCESFEGELLVIDEGGNKIRQLRKPAIDEFSLLSSDMVGYWRTFTIATAVEIGIFDQLPASLESLVKSLGIHREMLSRLLNALSELSLVSLTNEIWQVTSKGQYLESNHQKSLACAATEYAGDLLERWKELPSIIKNNYSDSFVFNDVATDAGRLSLHHKMLASYALHDYESLLSGFDIQQEDVVFDAAGGIGTLARLIQNQHPMTKVILGDLQQVIDASDFPNQVALDLFKAWPVKADKILLSRVLHDWVNEKALIILEQASKALRPNGRIFIIEMLLESNNHAGALCDLHLLAVTGGKERNLEEFIALASKTGLQYINSWKGAGLVSVMCFENGK